MFDPTKLGGMFSYQPKLITWTNPPTNSGQVVPQNPYRVSLLVAPFTSSIMLMLKGVNTALGFGFFVQQSNTTAGPTIISLQNYGPMCMQDWYWVAPAGTSGQIYVVETLWIPPGD